MEPSQAEALRSGPHGEKQFGQMCSGVKDTAKCLPEAVVGGVGSFSTGWKTTVETLTGLVGAASYLHTSTPQPAPHHSRPVSHP